MATATSRLQGWEYIKSLMYECPECGQKPFLSNTVYSNKWQCACMNACCPNMNVTVHINPFMAIHEWNVKYGIRSEENGNNKNIHRH